MELRAGKQSSIEYFRANRDHFAEIVLLVKQFKAECDGLLFSEEDLIACPQSPGHPLSHMRDSLYCDDSFVVLARDQNELAGFLKFDRGQTSKSRHRGVFTMAIKRSHWGRGIGTGLLRNLEAWAKSEQIKRLELNVLENNSRAIRLYQKEGYVFEGHKRFAAHVNGEFVSGYWMAKILPSP